MRYSQGFRTDLSRERRTALGRRSSPSCRLRLGPTGEWTGTPGPASVENDSVNPVQCCARQRSHKHLVGGDDEGGGGHAPALVDQHICPATLNIALSPTTAALCRHSADLSVSESLATTSPFCDPSVASSLCTAPPAITCPNPITTDKAERWALQIHTSRICVVLEPGAAQRSRQRWCGFTSSASGGTMDTSRAGSQRS